MGLALAPIAAAAANVDATPGNNLATSGPFTMASSMALPSASSTGHLMLAANEADAAAAPKAAAVPGFSPSSINFGSVAYGNTSTSRTVTFTSYGGTFSGFDTNNTCYGGSFNPCSSGSFMCSSNCAATSSSCTITASFMPFFYGVDSTTIYACDGSFPPNSLALTGTGTPPPPVTFSPTSWDFGTFLIGSQSASRTFFLFNPSAFTMDIGPLETTLPDFVVTSSTCGATLAPLGRCTASVYFAPQGVGMRTGQLIVPNLSTDRGKILIDTFFGPPLATADLSGTGTVQAGLTTPSSVDFGRLVLGGAPATRSAQLGNNGNAILTLSSISVTDPFTQTNDCPVNLSPGDTCTIQVGFNPVALGSLEGMLTIESNDASSPRNVPVDVTVVVPGVPDLRVTPTTMGFGDRMAGTLTGTQRVTVTNVGGSDALLQALTIDIDYLIVTSDCGATLTVGSSCFADVAFRPLGFGPRPGKLTVNGNDASSPHFVNLNGAGCRPFMYGRPSSCAP